MKNIIFVTDESDLTVSTMILIVKSFFNLIILHWCLEDLNSTYIKFFIFHHVCSWKIITVMTEIKKCYFCDVFYLNESKTIIVKDFDKINSFWILYEIVLNVVGYFVVMIFYWFFVYFFIWNNSFWVYGYVYHQSDDWQYRHVSVYDERPYRWCQYCNICNDTKNATYWIKVIDSWSSFIKNEFVSYFDNWILESSEIIFVLMYTMNSMIESSRINLQM